MLNRNFLGAGLGHDRCLELIEKLHPTCIFNAHIPKAFDFTEENCRVMRANLAERKRLFAELVPWDDPNYGTDEAWVRCDPYEQQAKPGDDLSLEVVVTNHSSQPRHAACRLVVPHAWGDRGSDPMWTAEAISGTPADWPATDILPRAEGRVRLKLRVPAGAKPGRYVVPVDVRYDHWALPQFREAIVEVSE
jgi:hypothetical protein